MYRVYDTLEKCCYTIEKARKVKKENPTAPSERWIFVAIRDNLPDSVIFENLVVVKPCLPTRKMRLGFAYALKELRLNSYIKNTQHARKIYAEKQGVRIVRVASVSGNKKTLESLLGCQID